MKTKPVKIEDAADALAGIPNPHDRLIHVLRNGLDIGDDWPVDFNMCNFASRTERKGECGTAACIAGFAGLLTGSGRIVVERMGAASLVDFLGISFEDADRMAYPHGAYPDEDRLRKITAEQAIRMLEIHRDTGKVDWSSALEAA